MPATSHPSAARLVAVLGTAFLVPGLLAPSAASAHTGTVDARAVPGSGVVAPSALGAVGSAAMSTGSTVAASAPTAESAATSVRQPRLTEVGLSGVNQAVLATAPDPDDHGHGTVGALSSTAKLKPAVAAKVRIARPAALVAVTADRDFPAGTSIQIRVKEKKNGWSDWTTLEVDPEHGPDPRSEEARTSRPGSDPLMTVKARKAQVRIDTPSGKVPKGTTLALVNAPTAPSDRTMSARSMSAKAVSASSTVSQPAIVTRSQWGADESWRSREPYYTDNIRAGFIHHTASTSSYTAAQAAAQIRAIYAYHTKSLGHSDIDYNFVVDRFGRLYEGRYGGMDRPVLGGHTAGFNEHTFAAVGLGNFESFSPSDTEMAAIKDSLARLFAWKLGLHGVNPAATVQLVSAGYIKATRYPKGSVATILATSTHQTVNYTACPGKYLQAQVEDIASLGAAYSDVVITAPSPPIDAFESGSRDSLSVTSSSTKAVNWTADVLSPCSDTPIRTYSGSTAGAEPIGITWDLRDGAGTKVLPATYTIRLSGTEVASGLPVAVVTSTVTITPKSGEAWGPCANASRVSGAGDAETSVLWGRISAPDGKVVVLTGEADAGTVALSAGVAAAPLARSLGAPLLVTPATSLASSVAADIKDRQPTEVIIVGGTDVISSDVASAVAALGFPVSRLSGASRAATAAAVAARMGPSPSAVLVSPDSPAHALAGAALAADRGIPVLLAVSGVIPSKTSAALSGLTSLTVATPTTALDDATLDAAFAGRAWTRLAGASAVSASVAVASGFPGKPTAAVVLPESSGSWGTATVAAAAGSPLLFTTSPVLATEVADYLGAQPSIGSTSTPVSSGWLDDQVLGAMSRVLLGLTGAPPGVAPPTVSPTARPTTTYSAARVDATPEPVRKGATLKVKSKVKSKYTNGKWRKVPKGVDFKVQFKASGKKRYVAKATGYTKSGWAKARVTANKSGRWRIVVGSTKSKPDFVRVRK